MAIVQDIKRLNAGDFSEEYQELVSQLALCVNPLAEQMVNAFNNNIDFNNLNQQIAFTELSADNNGVPLISTDVRVTLKTKLRGVEVISIQNLESNTELLTGAPFVLYELISGGFRVRQVTGLVPNRRYRLTLKLIG